jgi:hypothetical protein
MLQLVSQDEDDKESSVMPMSLASPPSFSSRGLKFFTKPRNIRNKQIAGKSLMEEANQVFQEKLVRVAAEEEEKDVGTKTGEALLVLFEVLYQVRNFDEEWFRGVYSWLLWIAKVRGHAGDNIIEIAIEFMWLMANDLKNRIIATDLIIILFACLHYSDPIHHFDGIGPSEAYCARKAIDFFTRIQKWVRELNSGFQHCISTHQAAPNTQSEEAVREYTKYCQSMVVQPFKLATWSVDLIRTWRGWVDEGDALSPERHRHNRDTVDDLINRLEEEFGNLMTLMRSQI